MFTYYYGSIYYVFKKFCKIGMKDVNGNLQVSDLLIVVECG